MHLLSWTLAAAAALTPAFASPPPPAPPATAPSQGSEVADVVAREKLRADVEALLADLQAPGEVDSNYFQNISDRFLLLGPGVVPYLINELEREDVATFHQASYTLSHLEGPGIEEGLRKAVERLGKEEGDKRKRTMKASAAYALAVRRVPDIVDIMLSGSDPVGRMPWMEHLPLLEVATVIGGRDTALQLLARLDGLRKDLEREWDLLVALEALGASLQPEVAPKLLPIAEDERTNVRIAALTALGQLGVADAPVLDALFAHLDAGNVMERQAAIDALYLLRPLGREKALLAKLETESDAGVRGQMYMTLAELLGEPALEAFVSHWRKPDALDRVGLMRAVNRVRSPKGANLLRHGLQDSDARVVSTAMEGLARLPGPGPADTLLALLRDPREHVTRDAVQLLALRRETRAGGRIADMLLQELQGPKHLTVGDRRDRFRVLGEALVELRFTAVSEDLAKAAAAEEDLELQGYLSRVVRRLDTLRVNGEDRAKWAPLLKSDDPDLRQLARKRLGELGGAEAARALAAAFGRDVMEDRVLLGELGRTGSQEAAALLEKVLLEPAFDPMALRPLREGAAYGARLLGGPRMQEALRRGAERRQGRDGMVLVYYALAAGKDALPLLRETRGPSLTWYEWNRGKDLERTDFLLRRLGAGLTIVTLDEPPEYLSY